MVEREDESGKLGGIPVSDKFYRFSRDGFHYIKQDARWKYACEKCAAIFDSQKKLKEHRFEAHSY